MGHKHTDLVRYDKLLRSEYPEPEYYTILWERELIGTTQRPDLMVVATHEPSFALCALELGIASDDRIQTYIDEGIPDVRWYSHEGEIKREHLDKEKLERRKEYARACVPSVSVNEFRLPQEKWTQSMRRELFACTLYAFGPVKTWPGKKPADMVAYKNLCNRFAKMCSGRYRTEFEPKAVEQQLDWACGEQKRIIHNQMHTFLMCKSAAREVGLIGREGLPGYLYIRGIDETYQEFKKRINTSSWDKE